jgi:heme-degrading monooxygenase HmoA
MFVVIWEFYVACDRQPAFERAYSPSGSWSQLFGKASGYLGTDLLACNRETGRYLTIDKWKSMEEFELFKRQFSKEYERLDTECEQLTKLESHVGSFLTR